MTHIPCQRLQHALLCVTVCSSLQAATKTSVVGGLACTVHVITCERYCANVARVSLSARACVSFPMCVPTAHANGP